MTFFTNLSNRIFIYLNNNKYLPNNSFEAQDPQVPSIKNFPDPLHVKQPVTVPSKHVAQLE